VKEVKKETHQTKPKPTIQKKLKIVMLLNTRPPPVPSKKNGTPK
jgi:hypothetical protein